MPFRAETFARAHAVLLLNCRNEIGQLPDELGDMHALRSLRAHSNNLDTVPTSVGGLVSLELCDLSSNRYGCFVLPNGWF